MSDNRNDYSSSARARGDVDGIEQDIGDIRARMDATLDELEYRLSPGQMTGYVADVVRDVVQGRPTRIARAIRDNPIPVAMIGIGALWLAWAVTRTPEHPAAPGPAMGPGLSEQRVRILLTGLIGACQQGAEGCREADAALDDSRLSPRLLALSGHLERSAAALAHELRMHGGAVDPDGPLHPAWDDLFQVLGTTRSRVQVLASLEHGLDGTLAVFRDTLHEPLPEELQVVVGAHFHEIETMRHQIAATREALA